MAYEIVNRAWPATVPPLTEQEAASASRRLWRYGLKRKWEGRFAFGKIRGRAIVLAPGLMTIDVRYGWLGLVHNLSHRIHYRKNSHRHDYDTHDWRHEALELAMVRYVVAQGWLDGKLKRPEKIVVVDPLADLRAKQIKTKAAIKRWTTKAKRADTALRKLRRRERDIERRIGA